MSLDKLLLLSLRSPYLDDSKVYPPLGILYLKSAVEQETSTEVDLLDDYDLTKPEVFEPYDVIGLSVMTPQRQEALRVLETVKKHYPDKIVAIGGPHALHNQEEVTNQAYDYVSINDGQRNLINILNEKAERVQSDKMNRVDWANQPRPDRTSDKARKFLESYHYKLQGKRAGTMLTATGCPEQCTFCFKGETKIMTPKGWRLIKDLKKRDCVITFNEKTGRVEDGKIIKTFKRKTKKLLKIWLGTRKCLYVTPEHPFYQYGEWVQAKDLKKGDVLHTLKSQVMEETRLNYSKSSPDSSPVLTSYAVSPPLIP